MKIFLLLLLAAVVGTAAWRLRDAGFVRDLVRPEAPPPAFEFDNDRRGAAGGDAPRGGEPAPTGLRKCLRGTEVLYTNGPCPAGSKERTLTGSAVTVVPGQRAAVQPPLPNVAASQPHVRDLLLKPGEPSLRDQQMERVIGK